jgi:signal transduction histidine kinase
VKRWLNTGTSEELGFIVNTRIRTINLAAIAGGCVSLIFSILNFMAGNYLLGLHTAANLLLMAGLVFCNATHNFLKGPVCIMTLLSLVLASNGLLFHNGMEFYVLLVVCLALILFNSLRAITFIIFFNSIIFLAVHKAAPHLAIQPATENRHFVNIIIWLALLLLCLYYFKKQSLLYLQRVETANEQLKASNHSKEKLFSIVAHDMRAPLNSLTGTLDLLNNEYIDGPTFRELSGLLANQTKHLNENMDVLLRWANSQLRGIEAHPKQIDLCAQITEIISLLQPLMEFKKIGVHMNCTDSMVFADADQVQLVLRNLLTNAIKFSYAKGVITITTDSTQAHAVWVHVQDSGVGMNAATIENLFNPANINSLPGTQNEKGIGLGLQLSKEFVQKNGGRITVKSEPGKGSTFSFSVPAA